MDTFKVRESCNRGDPHLCNGRESVRHTREAVKGAAVLYYKCFWHLYYGPHEPVNPITTVNQNLTK